MGQGNVGMVQDGLIRLKKSIPPYTKWVLLSVENIKSKR